MANLFSRLLKGQRTGMDTAVVGKKEGRWSKLW